MDYCVFLPYVPLIIIPYTNSITVNIQNIFNLYSQYSGGILHVVVVRTEDRGKLSKASVFYAVRKKCVFTYIL